MKRDTMVGGVDGVGKSSFLGILKGCAKDLGTIADEETSSVRLLDDCLEKGVSFTQETTLSGRRTESTARKARDTIRLYYIGLDPAEESLSRIENRVRKGGHDIARDSVLRRFSDRFESAALYCDWAETWITDREPGRIPWLFLFAPMDMFAKISSFQETFVVI